LGASFFCSTETAVEEYQIFSKDFCLNIFVSTNLFLPTSKRWAKKSNKNMMAKTITPKTNGKAKERPKDVQPTRTKERKELVGK
jgi:hypothetical protein